MNAAKRIEALREEGYGVKVTHLRRPAGMRPGWADSNDSAIDLGILLRVVPDDSRLATIGQWRAVGAMPHEKGGMTAVMIFRDHYLVARGEAVASPADHFNRRLGLTIALGRALSMMEDRP